MYRQAKSALRRTVRSVLSYRPAKDRPLDEPENSDSARYWSQYHVDAPETGFSSVDSSLSHYDWRNRLYPGYIELMPVDRADDLIVLDYGCGPGNDVIGFGHFSRPRKVYGLDVSKPALQLAAKRASLHGIAAEFIHVEESPVDLPLQSESVDVIHSSGVLHHTPDPAAILRQFRRIIKPDGYAQIMVYNYNSIWMHLFISYDKLLLDPDFAGLSKRKAFEKTTDASAPISNCYRPEEFRDLAESAGFSCTFLGASTSTFELKLLSRRFEALEDVRLDPESRKFLSDLTFNDRLWPLSDGHVAGVNACFRLAPA